MSSAKTALKSLLSLLSSNWMFAGLVFAFTLQGVWIAFSFTYPMLYDEYYHFGLIKHFSEQWSPFISSQNSSLDIYGSLERQPYLIYHYLMSFPLRLVAVFTNSEFIQILCTRILNILIFAGGFLAFRRVFIEMKIKPVFINIGLLFFILIPATPFVASTINYDSALFLLVPLLILLGLRIGSSARINWVNYALLVLVAFTGMLVKSAFLPVAFTVITYVILIVWKKNNKSFFTRFFRSFKSTSIRTKAIIIVPLLLIGLVFAERYVINIIQYHSFSPKCTRTLSEDRCKKNYVDLRAMELRQRRQSSPDVKPVQAPQFITLWGSEMIRSLLISGANTNGRFGTQIREPLPIVYLVVFLGSISAVISIAYAYSTLWRMPGFRLVIAVIAVYILSLFLVNISSYNTYYQPIAIQGRYLLPVLPFLIVFSIMGVNEMFGKRRVAKACALLVITVLFLNGGGMITHIVRSKDNWLWDSSKVRAVNNQARNILKPVIKENWYD